MDWYLLSSDPCNLRNPWSIPQNVGVVLSLSLLCLVAVALTGCRATKDSFYPIGIYSVPSTNDYREIRQAGFNVIAAGASQATLDAATRNGLRILASPGTSAGPQFDADAARRTVRAYDNHPALWAWYLVDEPDMHDVPPLHIREVHQFIKRLNAQKPTALVLYQGYEAQNYARLTDILMIDRYPVPWLPLANFPQHVRMARLGLGADKPLLAVIQTFDWSVYPELLKGKSNLRPPTYEELRCMTYSALVRGANGLFYFCFNDGKWVIQKHEEVWRGLREVVDEVNGRLPLFKGEHVWWPHHHQFGDSAKGFNGALESSIAPALLRVKKGNEEVKAGDYVIAVNTTDQRHDYAVRLPGRLDGNVNVLGEGRELDTKKGWIEDVFEPYSVHVYGPLGE